VGEEEEEKVKDQEEVVKGEGEWGAADWAPAGTADAQIVDTQCHIK